MPEIITKIPIGFGLDNYKVESSSAESTSGGTGISSSGGGGADGVSVGWNSAELDEDRWVKDKALKQVVVQVTCFQSAPLKYNDNGKTTYLNLGDNIDKWSKLPGAAWGATVGCTIERSLAQVKEMQQRLNGADLDAGFGFCPYTLCHYLKWFYGIDATWKQVNDLCRKRYLCAEMHINTGGSSGKAVRLKVVTSAGYKGFKGSTCSTGSNGGSHVAGYDKFDINVSVLLTKGYGDIVNLKSKKLGDINTGNLDFPWKDSYYDYKTGKIPGYNPNEMINWTDNKFGSLDVPIVGTVSWKSTVNTSGAGLPMARVRFFVEPENLSAAQAIIPGLTEEFSKTNYDEGQRQDFTAGDAGELSLSGQLQTDIAATAKYILEFCKSTNSILYGAHKNGGTTVFDGGGAFKQKSGSDDSFWANYKGKYILAKNNAWNGMAYHTDCSHFVTWVLNEVGACSTSSQFGSGQYCAGTIKLNAGYKLQKINNVADIMPGDILGWNMGKRHHAGIAAQAGNASIHYGAGGDGYLISKATQGYGGMMSPKAIPGSDQQANHYWRVVKEGGA